MAARSLNSVHLIGHLGQDAEPISGGGVKFSVATTHRWKDKQSGTYKEDTTWTDVVFWRGEQILNYLTRGKHVFVEGRLKTRSYEDRDGRKLRSTEVVADDVILLGGDHSVPRSTTSEDEDDVVPF